MNRQPAKVPADGVQGNSNSADEFQGNSNGADGVQGNSNGADGVQGNSNGADGAPPATGRRRHRLIGTDAYTSPEANAYNEYVRAQNRNRRR
ncbi:hypothetical protein V6N13_049445 [Hibiscus sabdariffa]|uniref:Uncharacterized protein n=1 Tax=Hibiscus sabdariffa TaxID=183260 RepID=A0ABR2QX58_9ROSI